MSDTPAGSWEISIDTGGTFTDCLAQDPVGNRHRIKVLSSGVLRGRVAAHSAGSRTIQIETGWRGVDDLVKGFEFRLLDRSEAKPTPLRVISYRTSEQSITLDQPVENRIAAGTLFELISPEPAPLLGSRLLTGTTGDGRLPGLTMRLGTTRGTNALLTRSGASPILFITTGFRDLLRIGTQARPDLFKLDIEKPEPIYSGVVEVDGRLRADGTEIAPLEIDVLARTAKRLVSEGHTVASVALMHADKNAAHEEMVADCLRSSGFEHVTTSTECAPFIKLLVRAETAVVDAYLTPVITTYLERIQSALGEGRLYVMTSAGGMVGGDTYRAKDSLLSGPAGGIAGAAQAGNAAGYERIIAFDMGGTSTDVARYDGDFEYVFEHEVGCVRLMAPALAIESVASGGGSICSYDGHRLKVGPESAGAFPGPACYGAGGPLTLTDVNLLLGRIDPDRFEIPISMRAAEAAMEKVCDALTASTGETPDATALLEGFLEIANQRMADAIHKISLRRGYDPADYCLVAFGGAGPQHAVAVAERLGIDTVLIPPEPSLLSAEGLSGAVIERFAERQILTPLAACLPDLEKVIDELGREAVDAVIKEGLAPDQVSVRRRIASLRYLGQDATLEVDIGPSPKESFEERYEATFGHLPEGRDVELVSVRVVASSPQRVAEQTSIPSSRHTPAPDRTERVRLNGAWREVATCEREELLPGARLDSPCLIYERYSVTVVNPGWQTEVDRNGAIIATNKRDAVDTQAIAETRPAAVRLELFTHRLETIAQEMGVSLQRTAVSTNVKERLDYSCAILDADGDLIVNAPHIPVHLGSLGLCIREVARAVEMQPGDCVVTNHPSFGGSHLPDITVISPIHTDDSVLIGYVASRAHHTELGGILPGSMPPNATRLIEEGVVIPPTILMRDREARWDSMERILTDAPYPSRAVADNIADLRAALAANLTGVTAVRRLAADLGYGTFVRYASTLKESAESKIRAALGRMNDGEFEEHETLDDGTRINVRIKKTGDHAHIDFTGTDGVHPGNLNATPAVVRSTVIYVLRVLIDEPLPLNEGLMRAVTLTIPTGMLNPPFPDDPSRAPAVVGGNVETSQRVVNALIRAFGLAASSQGTMNNLAFGTETKSYYETICGGCGAGPDFNGASAVHSHMTNTRITDPEVIEHRYPVRVMRFGVRPSSGGKGRHHGGDGAVRVSLPGTDECFDPEPAPRRGSYRLARRPARNAGKPDADPCRW